MRDSAPAIARHPDTLAIDPTVQFAAAPVFLQEGVEGAEQDGHGSESVADTCCRGHPGLCLLCSSRQRGSLQRGPHVASILCCACSSVMRPAQTARCRPSSSRSLIAASGQVRSQRFLGDRGWPPSPMGMRWSSS